MIGSFRLGSFSVVLLWVCASALPFAMQSTGDDTLIRLLSMGTPEERMSAVKTIRSIAPTARSVELKSALMAELDRLAAELQARRLELRTGQPIRPWGSSDYLFSLIDIVGEEASDPSVVPALLPFVNTGARASDAIAGFGEYAVGGVTAIAGGSSGATDSQVSSALFTLKRMLNRPLTYALSDGSRRLIVEVARQRLYGTQKPVVVGRAIELAVATGDSQLIARVRELAGDPEALEDMGIVDPSMLEYVQRRAVAELGATAR